MTNRGRLIVVFVVFLVFIAVWTSEYFINSFDNNRIDRFIKNADEIIYYYDATIVYNGIMNTQFKESVILIDYDSMSIAFLCSGDLGSYNEFKLTKTNNIIENPNLQTKVNLSFPGQTLTTYYSSKANEHRTTAIQIIIEDGSIYSISNIKDKNTGFDYYLGLKWSKYYVGG
ncbi:MAG: hypothetical protein FWH05_06080 [Oscillospiraceae bacterium]|nr:hypothetical protein [Oscillospiraceae bacterium]